MPKIAPLLVVLALGVTLFSTADAATDPSLPPAGAYSVGSSSASGSFTLNAARTRITNFHLPFNAGPDGECSSEKIPAKKIKLKISTPLKISKATRGGYTAYIVGRSTPSTSNGITAIHEVFTLAPGGKFNGTMYLAFRYDHPKTGDGVITIGNCTLLVGFTKR